MAKVLVIDDHATNRALIVTLLAHRGHTALEAAALLATENVSLAGLVIANSVA